MKLLLALIILQTVYGVNIPGDLGPDSIRSGTDADAFNADDWSNVYQHIGDSLSIIYIRNGFSQIYIHDQALSSSAFNLGNFILDCGSGSCTGNNVYTLNYDANQYEYSVTFTFDIESATLGNANTLYVTAKLGNDWYNIKWSKTVAAPPCTSEKNAYRDGKCCPNDSKDGCAALKTAYENCVAGTECAATDVPVLPDVPVLKGLGEPCLVDGECDSNFCDPGLQICELPPAGQCVPRDEWLGDGTIHLAMSNLNCFTLGDQNSCEAARYPNAANPHMGLSGDGQYCMWNTGVSAGCTESTPTAAYCKSDSDARLGKILTNHNSGFNNLQEFCQSLDADTCNAYSANHVGGYGTPSNACCVEP